MLALAASTVGDRIIFPHGLHVDDVGMACESCHEGIRRDTGSATARLPGKGVCLTCHQEDIDEGKCGRCHTVPDEAVALPRRRTNARFSHAGHLETGATCADCHIQALDGKDLEGKTCHSCHDGRTASNTCTMCHRPGQDLRPESHHERWLSSEGHGFAARFDATSCRSCHRQSYCDECHQGQADIRIHSPNYRYTHKLDAKKNGNNCAVCHSTRSFCITCHP